MSPIIRCNVGEQARNLEIPRFPDICPICGKGVEAIFIAGESPVRDSESLLQAVFQCPRNSCRGYMIAIYQRYTPRSPFGLGGVIPIRPEQQEYGEKIRELSPNFVEIYNQAFYAEQAGLDQISGPGYRKALEFLVKDYACLENPNDTDNIKKIQLGTCINNYINDPRIKSTAERAVWLGNDETHYVRKWTNQDVEDLKILIRVTVNWIENGLLTKQYVSNMPKP